MLIFMEKLQYSLIFMLYKTRYYRSGRGYIYRANQLISIAISLLASFGLLIGTKFRLDKLYLFAFFISSALVLFYLFERNVTKGKLLKHRNTYRNRQRYLKPFFVAAILGIIVFAVFYLKTRY